MANGCSARKCTGVVERWAWAAAKCRLQVAQEIDPTKQREKDRREAVRNLYILNDIAKDTFESRKAELRGNREAGRWWSPLKLYVRPKLGKVPVAKIDQTDAVFPTFPEAAWTEGKHVVAGDTGLSNWRFVRRKADGTPVDVRCCDVLSFDGDKIAVKGQLSQGSGLISGCSG